MKTIPFLVILAAVSLNSLQAANIVMNPGFETGDFTSWTVTLAPQGDDIFVGSGGANSGQYAAYFGATTAGDYDVLAQSLTTMNGSAYTFSFALGGSFPSEGEPGLSAMTSMMVDPVGDFQVFWDSDLLLDSAAGSTGSFNFTPFSFSVMGTGNDTITFKGYNLPSHYFLDDVSVASQAPEPATWGLMGTALAALCVIRRYAR